MKKIIFALIFVGAVLVLPSIFVLAARTDRGAAFDLPEQAGIYEVSGRPDLKLRVFVHPIRPDRSADSALAATVCNLSDSDSSAVVGPAGWHLPAVWTYNLNPTGVPSAIATTNWPIITANSFDPWSDALSGRVSIARGLDSSKTRAALDNTHLVTWGRTNGSALGITYVWYNRTTGVVTDLDTILNKKFTWAWSDPATWPALTAPGTTCAHQNAYDAQAVLTHEIGHWFGLDDEYASNFVDNTMYGYGTKMETKPDTLTTGDLAGLNALY